VNASLIELHRKVGQQISRKTTIMAGPLLPDELCMIVERIEGSRLGTEKIAR